MTSIAEFVAMFLHILFNSIGLVGNVILFYLVLAKTPAPVKTYSTLLFNFALFDFVGCLNAVFIQQRIIPVGTSLTYVSSGPCKYFGPLVCYISYSVMLHCYSHNLWSLFISFVYRYLALRSRPPTEMKLVLLVLSFYSISLFQLVAFSTAMDPPVNVTAIIHERFPEYDLDGQCVSGNMSIFEWRCAFTILHMTVPVSPVYTVIIILRHRITSTLKGQTMSENTKSMHRQLLYALTFQATIPAFLLFAVITYTLGQTGFFNHPYLEYSSYLLVGMLPVISPVGALYFIRPYHNWIRKNLLRQNVIVAQATYSTTNSIANTRS